MITVRQLVDRIGYDDVNSIAIKTNTRSGLPKAGESLNPEALKTDSCLSSTDRRVLVAIDDACAEAYAAMSERFEVRAISSFYLAGDSVPLLERWISDIAYYRLHDGIKLSEKDGASDHESRRRYTDALAQIKKACRSGRLLTAQGALVPVSGKAIFVESVERCCDARRSQ